MIRLGPFLLMRSTDWESQIRSRVDLALKDFAAKVLHSPDGVELELQPGMTEEKMWAEIGRIVGKRRYFKKKKEAVSHERTYSNIAGRKG